MLIRFETNRRWRITISSKYHAVAEQPTRAGINSLVSDPAPAATGDNYTCSASPAPSRYLKDLVEKDFPDFDTVASTKPRRRLWRFCRLLIQVDRMDPKHDATVDNGDPPPAYAHWPQNPSFYHVYELSDDCCASELPACDLPAEMESPTEQTANFDYGFEPLPDRYPFTNYSLVIDTTGPQTLRCTETPTAPGISDMQRCPERVPSLVIGGQSQKSSPISPETPNTNASYGFQLQSNKNLVSGVAQSPDDTPLSHNSWAEATGTYMEGYTSQPILASGLGRCFSGPSASIVRGSETDSGVQYKGHWHEVAETRYRDAGMHTTSNGGTPFALESSLATPIALSPNTGSVRLGQREYHELWGWQYGPSCDPRTDSSKAANFPTMEASLFKISHQTNQTAERRQSSNYAEFDDEPSPETNLDPGVDEGAEYAGVLCNQCKTVFRGKYSKGNLRRHVSNVHATLASALGLRCRFCKNTYKRRDATRKHEWKKHRSLDAKPKKRTKS